MSSQGRRLRLLIEYLAGGAVRRRVEAEDLVQEVYLRALSTRPEDVPAEEPGDAALGRWLNTIARHVVIDAARAARAAKRDGNEERLARSTWSRFGALPAAGPGPATQVVLAEDEGRLIDAYRSLSPDHRRVLGLRQFEGLSAAEAGRRMGRSEVAVHSLFRRALEAWEDAAQEKRTKERGE